MEEFEKLVAESFQGELMATEEAGTERVPVKEERDSAHVQEIAESAVQKNSA